MVIKYYEMYNLCVVLFCFNCIEIIIVISKKSLVIFICCKEIMDKILRWCLNF